VAEQGEAIRTSRMSPSIRPVIAYAISERARERLGVFDARPVDGVCALNTQCDH